MLSNFLKWAAIAALLIAVFVSTSSKFGFALSLVPCIGACIVGGKALRAREYGWAGLFLMVALIFNPVFPLPLPYSYALVVNFLCLGLFAGSLVHSNELLTVPVESTTLRRVTVKNAEGI
ncbi:MAG: hypothetical protein DMG61_03465 [Acidobacteria bacterium]|nr:MAG: hypothetical protein DMG61_03465 [Acidobacteriota bacterium]PYY17625.1 MAG: hypothetical protein DMG60_10940 [Acidobacteriota bacterium]